MQRGLQGGRVGVGGGVGSGVVVDLKHSGHTDKYLGLQRGTHCPKDGPINRDRVNVKSKATNFILRVIYNFYLNNGDFFYMFK